VRRLLFQTFLAHDSTAVELLTGWLLVFSGAWLLWPADTFATSAIYTVLGDESAWGVGMVALGLGTLIAASHDAPAPRSWVMAGVCWGFSFWAIRFWQGNPITVGVPAYLILALFSAWAFVQQFLRARRHRPDVPIIGAAVTGEGNG
jgi:hypothetical protein